MASHLTLTEASLKRDRFVLCLLASLKQRGATKVGPMAYRFEAKAEPTSGDAFNIFVAKVYREVCPADFPERLKLSTKSSARAVLNLSQTTSRYIRVDQTVSTDLKNVTTVTRSIILQSRLDDIELTVLESEIFGWLAKKAIEGGLVKLAAAPITLR